MHKGGTEVGSVTVLFLTLVALTSDHTDTCYTTEELVFIQEETGYKENHHNNQEKPVLHCAALCHSVATYLFGLAKSKQPSFCDTKQVCDSSHIHGARTRNMIESVSLKSVSTTSHRQSKCRHHDRTT
jgi:hypothetical protein